MLKDILINLWEDVQSKDKAYTLLARYPGAELKNTIERSQKDMVAAPICLNAKVNGMQPSVCDRIYDLQGKGTAVTSGWHSQIAEPLKVREATKQGYTEINVGECVDLEQPNSKTRRGRKMQDKNNALTTQNEFYQYIGKTYEVKDGQIEVKGKKYPIKLSDGLYVVRKMSVDECKRLQTVPDWYDMTCISNSQAYKCLGNGWTIEVITHLIRATQEGKTEAKQLTFWEV